MGIAKYFNLNLDQDSMCIFIDESGNAKLKGQNAFCLGGCAVHSSQISHLEKQWKLLMFRLFGNPNHIFHATSDLAKKLSHPQGQKIYNFFKRNSFGRFGVGYHKNSDIGAYPGDPYQICADLLKHKGFIKILKNYPIIKPSSSAMVEHPSKSIYLPFNNIPFRKIIIIFEGCQRDKELIEISFSELKYQVNNIEITSECYFMEKKYAHACLQIADLISNTYYRELLRHYDGGKKDQGYDFKEIFHGMNDKINYFLAIDRAVMEKLPHYAAS